MKNVLQVDLKNNALHRDVLRLIRHAEKIDSPGADW
jgi:hypothetical protein